MLSYESHLAEFCCVDCGREPDAREPRVNGRCKECAETWALNEREEQ